MTENAELKIPNRQAHSAERYKMKTSFIKMKWQVILMTLLVGVCLLVTTGAYSQEDEAPITVAGTLEVMIAEDFRQAGQEQVIGMSYSLHADSGVTYELQFAAISPPPDLSTGQRATVTGIANGATLWVDTFTPDPNPPVIPMVGDRHAVILLVDLQDVKISTRYTTQQIADLMYTGASSVRDLYLQSSLGQLNFVPDTDNNGQPDVFGPFLVNYSYSPANTCDYITWTNAAEAAAQAAGIDLSPYQHRIFVLPHYSDIPACTFSGRTYVGCNTWCRMWITEGGSPMVYAHELGHNLGLAHAGTDPENDGIINNEYGDYSDPMGSSRDWHMFGGPHVDRLGWYEAYPGSIVTVTQSGDYTIEALSAIPPVIPITPRVLKVQRPNNQGFYYMSYRQPVGYDVSIPSPYTQGVNIHRYWGPTAAAQTSFIQSLTNNQSFLDDDTGIQVTQTGASPNSVSVHIEMCVGQAPTVTLTPASQALRPGDPASYTVTVANQDGGNCPTGAFTLSYTGAPPGALTPASLQLSPGAGGTATLTLTTTGMASNAYSLQVQAANSNSGAGAMPPTGAGGAALIVDNDPPTPPTGLQGYANSQGWITLGWNAASDTLTGIQSYAIYRDGVFRANTSNLSYTDSTTAPNTTYSYTVKATDGVGNVSPTSAPLSIFSTCYANTPIVTLSPASLIVKPNGGASFNISVTNNDSTNCAPTTWTLSRIDAAGGTLTPTSLPLNPGQSGTATLTVATATAGAFTVVAQAADNDGVEPNHAQSGTGSTMLMIDGAPPTPPTNLQGSIDAQGRITLSWSAATDVPSGVEYYRIYRGGVLIGQTTTLSYVDMPSLGPTYRYTVTAVDRAGNESSPSAFVDVSTVCTAANPTVTLTPNPLAAKLSVVVNYTVTVTNKDTGPCAATTFTLTSSVSSTKVTIASPLSPTTLTLVPGQSGTATLGVKTTTAGTYTVSVKAEDKDGKAPTHSTGITGSASFIGDSTAPTAPTNLQASSDAITGVVQLGWNAATDSGSGIQFYTLIRNGVTLGQTSDLTYPDTTAALGTAYSYTATATDKAGNVSPQSNTVQLLDGCSAQAPLVTLAPSGQTVKAGVAATYTVTVVNQDGLTYCPATTFTLSYAGTPTGTLTPTSLPLSPGQSGTATLQVSTTSSASYTLQVNAADNDGVAPSHLTGTASATFISDGTAPTKPGSLRATVSPGQVKLTWTASTDTLSGVQGYRIYRGPSSSILTYLGSSTTTSYTDSAVVKGTIYYYAVSAVDQVDPPNESAKTTAVKVTAQ